MLPILLNLGFVKIYTFGVFLVLAFFWGSFLLWRLTRLTSFKEEEIFDGLFWSLAGGLFFGRLVYIILNFKEFGFSLLKFILINGYPGLSLYGAILGGVLTISLYFLSKKIKFREAIDYYIPALFLALAFGKLGSFFSGTEVGIKTKFLLAVKYVDFDGLRHIPAFYEALAFFLAAFLAYRLIFIIRREKLSIGFNGFFFIWYFSLVYLVFDKLKLTHLYLGKRSFNELVSAILFLTATIYSLYYFRTVIIRSSTMIINYLFNHVKKTSRNLYSFAKKKTGGRVKKNTASD